jgi:DNA ligase-1
MNNILNAIRETASKNEKESIIRQNKDNTLFRLLLEMTYSPLIKFGIKAIPAPLETTGELLSLEQALNELKPLMTREITGHSATYYLACILGHLEPDNKDIIEKVINRSLKLGCSTSTINKAIEKNFIKEAPYMGCKPYSSKAVDALFDKYDTVYSQVKLDGRYTNVVIDNGISMESRQGLPTDFGSHFDFLLGLDEVYGEPLVLHGELVMHDIDRYTANGIISSIVSISDKLQDGEDVSKELTKFQKEHGETYDEMLSRVSIVTWDFIPLSIYKSREKWSTKYSERLEILKKLINSANNERLSLVEIKIVKNKKEALEHFYECRNHGEEGTVLKGDSFWVDSKPSFQIKLKTECLIELIIKSPKFGGKLTKNKNLISSLNVESSDGLLKTTPAGMSEKVMAWVTENINDLIGTIITVKCNGISHDRDGNYSCLHPVVMEFRTDKNIANSLEECLEIDMASLELSD